MSRLFNAIATLTGKILSEIPQPDAGLPVYYERVGESRSPSGLTTVRR